MRHVQSVVDPGGPARDRFRRQHRPVRASAPAKPAAPAAKPVPLFVNPSFRFDLGVGLVVIEFHDNAGSGDQLNPEPEATRRLSEPSGGPAQESRRRRPKRAFSRWMARLLLADRVKGRDDTFLAPLIPALDNITMCASSASRPVPVLAEAIHWADIVWLEWCWDHAVWATTSDCLNGKRCVIRLHSIEALQTDFPAKVNWSRVDRLITVGEDITALLFGNHPAIGACLKPDVIPNGIDLDRFVAGSGDRHLVAWVGHLEPKKNPMLLLQIAHTLHRADPRYVVHVAGAFTDLRTARYVRRMMGSLGLDKVVRFDGPIADMPAWYTDKGMLLSTSMYESFGLNIGEAMAVGAFPVVHDFPGADRLWPVECLFASVEQAVALIRSGRPGLYRDWVAARYGLKRQEQAVLRLLAELT